MSEQVRQRHAERREDEISEQTAAKLGESAVKDTAELDAELDALLDSIDDVLEENARAMVENFRQRGGQ